CRPACTREATPDSLQRGAAQPNLSHSAITPDCGRWPATTPDPGVRITPEPAHSSSSSGYRQFSPIPPDVQEEKESESISYYFRQCLKLWMKYSRSSSETWPTWPMRNVVF